ncbi:TPA: tail fiber assembly protein [Yersinia enterocolitica]|nr:tail fiber assembly protein [Yersinia enterocolitica]HDL6655097.1 tail fiber assembly protein [Yersinia enterocolitica]HDL6681214.1 tail fiber assembly protein [Yersinia enterocolitica]
MSKYIFCANNERYNPPCCGFWSIDERDSYPSTFPEHGVEVDKMVMKEFTATAPNGKALGADSKGHPAWVDLPAPTPEERAVEKAVLIAQTKLKKSKLMTEASNKIDVLRDRIDAGQDKEGELKLWKVYRIELDDVDVSVPVWPVSPE